MVKIITKLCTSATRYMKKNTVNGRYNRYMDGAVATGTGAIVHAFSTFPNWTPEAGAINLSLWGMYFANAVAAIKNRLELTPIIKRAKLIKKASQKAGHKIWQ